MQVALVQTCIRLFSTNLGPLSRPSVILYGMAIYLTFDFIDA